MVDTVHHRCPWCGNDPLYIAYHDEEWGVPQHDDRQLFEMLCLEGAQAGLSWITILKKRPAYRQAFDEFDPQKIARYNARKINSLLLNEGIVRNRLKIEAFITNARAYIDLMQSQSSFDNYLWQFVGGRPVQNRWRYFAQVPSQTEISGRMSKDLKQRGFSFVGSTICYAFMQAVGIVNDHLTFCYRYEEVKALAKDVKSEE